MAEAVRPIVRGVWEPKTLVEAQVIAQSLPAFTESALPTHSLFRYQCLVKILSPVLPVIVQRECHPLSPNLCLILVATRRIFFATIQPVHVNLRKEKWRFGCLVEWSGKPLLLYVGGWAELAWVPWLRLRNVAFCYVLIRSHHSSLSSL